MSTLLRCWNHLASASHVILLHVITIKGLLVVFNLVTEWRRKLKKHPCWHGKSCPRQHKLPLCAFHYPQPNQFLMHCYWMCGTGMLCCFQWESECVSVSVWWVGSFTYRPFPVWHRRNKIPIFSWPCKWIVFFLMFYLHLWISWPSYLGGTRQIYWSGKKTIAAVITAWIV